MAEVLPLRQGDPERLGAYELVGRLGEGGQGTVYLGQGARERVAVKLLHAQLREDHVARTRFVRELAAIERIAGFCTARVYAADVEGDRPYIVSEFVPGPSLHELVRDEGPRTEGSLMRLAVGTATALAAIHRAGIVHRDFKPPNVLMGPDGPRVIDFGIAKALDNVGRTVTGHIVGTPAYMAPEQFTESVVGPAADLFAWGATMVFAATGESAFAGGQVFAVMHRIRFEHPDLSALPPELMQTVQACLAKDPSRRPTSDELLWTLLGQTPAHLQQPSVAPPSPSSPLTLDETPRLTLDETPRPATRELTFPPGRTGPAPYPDGSSPPFAEGGAGGVPDGGGDPARTVRRSVPLTIALVLATLLSFLDMAALFVASGKPAGTAMAARFLVLSAVYAGLGVVTLFGVVAAWRGYRSGVWTVLGSRLARAAVGIASLPFVTVLPLTIAVQGGVPIIVALLLVWALTRRSARPTG